MDQLTAASIHFGPSHFLDAAHPFSGSFWTPQPLVVRPNATNNHMAGLSSMSDFNMNMSVDENALATCLAMIERLRAKTRRTAKEDLRLEALLTAREELAAKIRATRER